MRARSAAGACLPRIILGRGVSFGRCLTARRRLSHRTHCGPHAPRPRRRSGGDRRCRSRVSPASGGIRGRCGRCPSSPRHRRGRVAVDLRRGDSIGLDSVEAGDVIDRVALSSTRCSLNSQATSLPSMTMFLIVSLGLKSVNALSKSFASSATPRERLLPVTQVGSALKQTKRWSRSRALNAATWSLTIGQGRRPRLCRERVRCAYGRSSALRTGRARRGSGRLRGKRRRSRSPGRRRP